MDIVGNLLVVKDYSSARSLLFEGEGHYELLFGTDQEYDFAGNLESLYNSEKTPYLYFQKNSLAGSSGGWKARYLCSTYADGGRLPGSRWTVIQNIHFLTGSIWMRAGIFCCYTGKTRTGRNSEHIG